MGEISISFTHNFNYFNVKNFENSLHLKSFEAELEKTRTEDMKSLKKSVNEVSNDFESLKSKVCKVMENPDYLKKKLHSIKDKIIILKDAINEELCSLLKEEVNLCRDVQFVDKKIEEWGKPVDFQAFKPTKKINYEVNNTTDENPAVEFQKFLSCSGGHYGGWEEQDHLLFLRERNKHKKNEKFFSVVHTLLPDLSYDEIKEHENWYQKYESLKNCLKEAIQKWKSEKESKQKNNSEKGEGERKKVKKKVRNEINIAERIKKWKDQQLLKKLEEEERQKKEKEKLKEEEKRKKQIQEIKKQAVAEYKSKKFNKLQEIISKEENRIVTEEGRARNKILLKAFRLQDLKFIEKKKIIKLQVESKFNEKFERLKLAKPALEIILERNPQRIFQPTLIWSQHCLENQKREKLDPVFDLNSIPRLAIPEWRRDLK